MSIGAVNSGSTYNNYDVSKKNSTDAKDAKKDVVKEEKAAVYESSKDSVNVKPNNAALVNKLKADSQNRINQMQSLVETMFKKQGITIGTADDMWKKLASGDFTADAETIAKAKEDISEDGYWGVNQTSDRIFDFAKALSGGDKEKMKDMLEAVKKGFGEATKTWGKELPDISQKTYDAVQKKFDDFFDEGEEA